jgi:hypothetical protein
MAGYPLFDIFLTTVYVFCWVIWLMLLFLVIWDIFRSGDLSGWVKAGWLVCVIVLPLLGVLAYLMARGGTTYERQAVETQRQDEAFRAPGRDAAGTDGHSQSDEFAKLAGLHEGGVISEEEFEQAKARVLA